MIVNKSLGHLKISIGDIKDFFKFIKKCISENKSAYCVPLNLTKYVVSKKDIKLKKVIYHADLIIADGIPIVWLSRRAGYNNVNRLTGIDFAEEIISRSKEYNWTIFLLGATSQNLECAIKNLKKRFNNPNIVGYHHGYFKENEIEKIINQINSAHPNILLIGMGMPQKEYFVYDYFNELNINFCLLVGGAFDVWAGQKKRTPKVLQTIGLEWLYRSIYNKSKALNIGKYGLTFLKDFLFYRKYYVRRNFS